jgi:hypothetical protein
VWYIVLLGFPASSATLKYLDSLHASDTTTIFFWRSSAKFSIESYTIGKFQLHKVVWRVLWSKCKELSSVNIHKYVLSYGMTLASDKDIALTSRINIPDLVRLLMYCSQRMRTASTWYSRDNSNRHVKFSSEITTSQQD